MQSPPLYLATNSRRAQIVKRMDRASLLTLLCLSFFSADPLVGAARRLGKPLIGDNGMVYSCSGKNLYAFQPNGTIAGILHLNYTCNLQIDLVYAGKSTIYVVAENRVMRINALNNPAVELFLDPEKDGQEENEVIAISSSMIMASVYISIKNQGLYAYTLQGQERWSILPHISLLGYPQSCRKNVTDCHFTSSPVVDQCEISNNQGELYSLSVGTPRLKWLQDFSSYDKAFTVTPGNNDRVYVTIPSKEVIFALDVSNGDIMWQRSIGPLSSINYKPVVDSNGWISVGSLDGLVYSISPTGIQKKFVKGSPQHSVVQASPFLDCSGCAIYVSRVEMEERISVSAGDLVFISASRPSNVFFTLLVPATGCVYWSESYLGPFTYLLSNSELGRFLLDETVILAFIAASNVGNPLACRTSRLITPACSDIKSQALSVYTGNERSILMFLLFETILLVALAITVRFCFVFWGKRKLQNQGLGQFLEKRRSLHQMKKEFDKSLKQKTDAPEIIEKLMKEREGLHRKLSTSYSLGHDVKPGNTSTKLQRSQSLLPLYDGGGIKKRSYSFDTYTDTEEESESTEEEKRSPNNNKSRGKQIIQVESSSSEDYYADSGDG